MSTIKTPNLPTALSAPAQQELQKFDDAYWDYHQSAPSAPMDVPRMFVLWVFRDGFCHGCQDFRRVYSWQISIEKIVGELKDKKFLEENPCSSGTDWYCVTAAGMNEINRFPRTPDQKVVLKELQEIVQRRKVALEEADSVADATLPADKEAFEEAAKMELVGLAFSGGGIRSATFNLGFLQGLAGLRLLKYVDYLSTVSGGGYIGNWLAAWIHRAGLSTVERELHPNRISQIPRDGEGKPKASGDEPAPIFHLRRFSNYLSPKLGLLSADMWVLVAIYVRNFLACQLVLFPAAIAVLLLSRLVMLLYHARIPETIVPWIKHLFEKVAEWSRLSWISHWDVQYFPGIAIMILWLLAAYSAFQGAARLRPEDSRVDESIDRKRKSQGNLIMFCVVPLLLSAILFCWMPALRLADADLHQRIDDNDVFDWSLFLAFVVIPAIVVQVAYLCTLPFHRTWRPREIVAQIGSTLLASVVGGVLLFCVWNSLSLAAKPGPGDLTDYVQARAAARVTTFGPPLVLGVMIFGIFTGLALLRGTIGEEMREWWSRLCAWLMIFGVVWISVNFVAIYATALVLWADPFVQTAIGSGWLFTVLGGVWAGRSANTGAKKSGNRPLDWLANLAPTVFVAGLLIGMALLLHMVFDRPPNWERAAQTAEWTRRTEPLYPSKKTTTTHTKTADDEDPPNKELKEYKEYKEVVERSKVYDQRLVVGLVYWVSMFNTDPTFVPEDKFELRPEDVRYLTKTLSLKPGIASELAEKTEKTRDSATKAPPEDANWTLKKFKEDYREVLKHLPSAENARPGEATRKDVLDAATDAQMIVFDPVTLFIKLVIALAACVVLFVISIFIVDVNRFSLHALYGNRLMRCYLGASNDQRSPDPLSGFDPGDDLRLTDLKTKAGYDGPLVLINTALNLVAGKELAWQERKASSFVMTPLMCGSQETGYCHTQDFADNLRLSTAMTISGAAASPNSGYNSSPAVTALLTVFNARLGAWLGNPSKSQRGRTSPKAGFLHLLGEMFGQTDSESHYVYLSDGGHFENVGGYELVRRRCRYIIISDADADGDHLFENLGNLIHKCRADFGIRIEIDLEALHLAADSGRTRWHCAIGKIRYDDVDYGAVPGTLIYVKPSLTGDEPADILHYKTAHPTFPHETTLDQFFSESQFESYRALGQHIAHAILADSRDDMNLERADRRLACRALFSSLTRRWFAMPPGYESSFVQTTLEYMGMQKSLSEEEELHWITEGMYPELGSIIASSKSTDPATCKTGQASVAVSGAANAESARSSIGLHTLLRMLQIMENAWLSLNLDVCYAHPLNRGWMSVFYRWTSSKLFLRYWPVLRGEFARSFVEFCERQLRTGSVEILTMPMPGDATVPEILTREFSTQWLPLEKVIGLQERLNTAKGEKLGWLIYSRMKNGKGAAPVTPDDVPAGIILVTERAQGPNGEHVFDFLAWIRGAYRNTGIGREAVRKVLNELAANWRERTYRLRVELPTSLLHGPGGDLLKSMWLTFFQNLGFERTNPSRGVNEADYVLERVCSPKVSTK